MVAELLKLKLRLLGNTFIRSPRQNAAVIAVLVVCVALTAVAISALVALDPESAGEARTTVVLGGSLVVLAYLVLPLLTGATDALDPRRFALLGVPASSLAKGLALAAALSVPFLLTVIVAAFTIPVWSQTPGTALLAVLAAVIGLASCLLAARITSLLAALGLATRRAKDTAALLTVLVLLLASPAIVLYVSAHGAKGLPQLGASAADTLSWTPLGAAWALPGDVATAEDGGTVVLKLLIALVFLAVLWVAWRALVGRVLVTTQREQHDRESANLGWFARTPSTRSGAVAARSLTYWARDSRYPVPVIGVFGFLVVVFVAFVIAGIPLTYLVLITVPALCITLAFSVHNDVALDNTAVWLHVAASRVGLADRIGRSVPVLAMGIPLIAVGSVAAAYFVDDFDALPALLGVSTVLLLAGLGVGNALSAVFPYAAVRPGDGPFSQPQVGGGTGVVVQIAFVIITAALSAPSVLYAIAGLMGDSDAFWLSLWWGAGAGVVAFVAGTLVGGAVFDRRGPDILATALRN
jgi:ABC-2 type transport system permease protein